MLIVTGSFDLVSDLESVGLKSKKLPSHHAGKSPNKRRAASANFVYGQPHETVDTPLVTRLAIERLIPKLQIDGFELNGCLLSIPSNSEPYIPVSK